MNNDGEDATRYACVVCLVNLATDGPDEKYCRRCAPRCDNCGAILTADRCEDCTEPEPQQETDTMKTLDDIIDRNAVPLPAPAPAPTVKRLRPFTDADWNAFSGCDSPEPEIFEGQHIGVVLDNHVVDVWAWQSDAHLMHEAKNQASAREIAERIAEADGFDSAVEIVTAAKLTDRGFVREGEAFVLKVSADHFIRASSELGGLPRTLAETVLQVFERGNDEPCAEWSVGNLSGLENGVAALRETIGDVEADAGLVDGREVAEA